MDIRIYLFAFGSLFSIIGGLCLILLNRIHSDIKALYTDQDNLKDRVTKIETIQQIGGLKL